MSVTELPSKKAKCIGCGKMRGHVAGCKFVPCPKCGIAAELGHLPDCPDNQTGEPPADKVIRTTVDGVEAVIDGTVPKPQPIVKRSTRDELIEFLRVAVKAYDEAKAAHKITTDDLTEAKKLVDLRARAVAEVDGDDYQMILGEDE